MESHRNSPVFVVLLDWQGSRSSRTAQQSRPTGVSRRAQSPMSARPEMKPLLLIPILLSAATVSLGAEPGRTHVAIVDGKWHINGAVTHRGAAAGGLLMNVRMVNATFEVANAATRPPGFDAEANTDRFIAHVPDYAARGVDAFTLCL